MATGGFQLFMVRMIGHHDLVGLFAAVDEAHLERLIDECVDAWRTEYREIRALGVFWDGPVFAVPDLDPPEPDENQPDPLDHPSFTEGLWEEMRVDGAWTTFAAGVVYLLEANGRYKIGYSANVPQRIKDLQTSCPYPLRLVAVVPGTVQDERRLHAQYKEYRKIGEWFELPETELEVLRMMGLPVPEVKQGD